MKLIPTGDNIVIKIQKAESKKMTDSGIIIPQANVEKQEQGEVVAAGPGRILNDGTLLPMKISEGDFVLYNKFAGTEISADGQLYLIIKENDILAIIKE